MNIVCLDMEGVLVPEIWIAFAEESGIPELRRTTRDEPDYDKLMRWRIDILRQHGLGLTDIQNTIRRIDPLPGAREFLDRLRTKAQVVILSDTFEQFGLPLMEKLNWPTPVSYTHLDVYKRQVFSMLLTAVFAAIVNVVMYFKLRRISMAESLKSIE